MISLPKLDGFEAVSLFFSILNDLATAPPDEVQQIGSRHDGSYQDDRVRRIVRFVEESYSRKLSLEEIGRSVDMSPSSVCRYFKRRTPRTCGNTSTASASTGPRSSSSRRSSPFRK